MMQSLRTVLLVFILAVFPNAKANYLAPAQDQKTLRWGYINTKGKKATKFKYRLAFNFNFGKAIVLSDKWYYLDKEELKEHVFDSFVQKYLNSAFVQIFTDSADGDAFAMHMVGLLGPPIPSAAGLDSYSDFLVFHFVAHDMLLLQGSYLRPEEPVRKSWRMNSFYHLKHGIVKEMEGIKHESHVFYGRFLGSRQINENNIFSDQLAVFDTSGSLLVDISAFMKLALDSLNVQMKRPVMPVSGFKIYDSMHLFSVDYWNISGKCICGIVRAFPNELDPANVFDTGFVINMENFKVYSYMKLFHDDTLLARVCDKAANQMIHGLEPIDETYNKLGDSLSNSSGKYTYYEEYYMREFISGQVESPGVYVFMVSQKDSAVRQAPQSGLWDAEKVILRPGTYRIIGIFK